MATVEWVRQALDSGKSYSELPDRVQALLPLSEWKSRVKEHCIKRGYAWSECNAKSCCLEQEYYEDLLRYYKLNNRLFPYHLADYVCRVMRLTPFRYYTDILCSTLKEEKQYDQLPNFTAADIVRHVGVGRNEYIAVLNACKGKKLMWRVNKGIARELLPQEPREPRPEPWWVVNVVNIGEAEYRSLGPDDKALLQSAAQHGGVPVASLDPAPVAQLYRQGLLYFDVPVQQDDYIAIPPLEGFVSNKNSEAGEDRGDPLEALMYAAFVAASERASIKQLAAILSVDLGRLQQALGVACRLGFASKVPGPSSRSNALRNVSMDGGLNLDLDEDGEAGSVREGNADGQGSATCPGLDGPSGGSATSGGSGIALVVDSEVTGYLMMGALSPGLKRHSVTLFEGGRITGADTLAELMAELKVSIEASDGFEGEMRHLAAYARSLSTALEAVRTAVGPNAPLEILRKENLSGLAPAAALRVLSHSYAAVVPITPLAPPPLPLPCGVPGAPTNYGPTAEAATPWLQLALWRSAGRGPPSLVLSAGQRLLRLPRELAHATHALLWPWASAAVRAHVVPTVVESTFLLFTLNEWMARSAVMVTPLALPRAGGGGGSAAMMSSSSSGVAEVETVDVPLPLLPAEEEEEASCDGGEGGAGLVRGVVQSTGDVVQVPLPQGLREASSRLGLPHAIGCLRLLQVLPGSSPVSVVPPVEGDDSSSDPGAKYRRSASMPRVATSGSTRDTPAPDDASANDGGAGISSTPGSSSMPPGTIAGTTTTTTASVSGRQLAVSPDPRCWLPLQLCLGLPLVPVQLCEMVCGAAGRVHFLEPGARRSHSEGQARLQGEVDWLVKQFGACSRSSGAGAAPQQPEGGMHGDSAAPVGGTSGYVDPPLYNLYFDGTTLRKHDLSAYLQGDPAWCFD